MAALQPLFKPFARRFAFALVMVFLAQTSLPHARAADVTWSSAGTSTAGGNGDWTGGSTWWNGSSAVSWSAGDNAIFSAAGNTTVNSAVSVGNITFSSSAANISILGGAGNITLNSGITATNTANTAARTFTISESIALGANQTWTVNNGGNTGTANLTVSGSISGTNFGITKEGNGTLTLSGAKSYTGGSTVNAGTLLITAGAISSNITINSGATLTVANHNLLSGGGNMTINSGTLNLSVFAQGSGPSVANFNNATITGSSTGFLRGVNTYNFTGDTTWSNSKMDILTAPTLNVISGTTTLASAFNVSNGNANLTKSGAGTLVLSAANTYTSTTILNAGTLAINNATAIGSGTLTIAGGTIDNTSAGNITLANNNRQNWNGNFTFAGTKDLNMGTGNVTMNASRTVTVSNGAFTVGGVISGSGFGLTKNGAGTLTLTGANTFTGATTISAGTLSIASMTNGGVAGSLGSSTNSAANLVLGGGSLLYTGSNASTDRNFTLTASTTSEINVSNAATELTISGTSASTNGALTKNGSGTLVLSGNNGHSGATTVNGGTLVLSGTNTGSAITINNGGSLLSNTSLGFTTVNNGGAIASGTSANSVGSLTVAGLTLNSGGTFTWDMSDATGAAGTGWDFIDSSGLLTIGATSGSKFTIAIASSGAPANWDYTSSGQTWDIITYGSLSGFSADKFAYDVSAFGGSLTPDSHWALSDTGSAIRLTYNYTATTPTWNGASGNWSSGFTPAISSGANLNFIGAGGTSTNNILSGNLSSIGSLLFTGTGAYTLQANSGAAGYDAPSALAIGSDITNSSSGTQTINLAISFAANHTISANSGDIVLGGPISGAGSITKLGANALTLSGTNTYSGGTTLSVGRLNINSATALGTGTLTINGGTLDNTSGSSITLSNNNAQNWNSDFSFVGTNDLNLGTGAVAMDASRTVTISNGNLTVGGVISGSGFGLTKSGSGTLTLNGNNTYTGPTTINAGTLVMGNAGGLGASGNVTFTGGELQYGNGITTDVSSRIKNSTSAILLDTNGNNVTFSSVVGTTNSGGLTKNGSGTLILTAANTYTGGTTVNAGTLQIGNRTNSTAGVTGTITLSGGNLAYDYNAANFGVNGAITLTAESTITKLNGAVQYNLTPGTLNGGGQTLNIYVDTTGGTKPLYFNQTAGTSLGQVNILNGAVGQASGTGLPLRNASINVSSGAQFRTFGAITINNNITLNGGAGPDNNGALYHEGGGGVATYSGTITLASATVSSIGTAGGAITISGQVTGSGSLTKIAANTLTLSNSATNYTGTTTVSAGTLAIGNNMTIGAITGSGNLSLGTGYTLTTNSSSSTTYSGVISGSGTLAKSGSSTLTLTGNNTYTGGTTLNNGTLVIGHVKGAGNGNITQTNSTSLLTFDTTGTIANAMSIFNVASNKTVTLTGAITAQNTTYDVADGTTLSLNGTISGSGGVTKNGTGTLVLSGNNTYLAPTVINAGTLEAASAGALGSNNTVDVTGGTLLVTANNALAGKNIEMSGSGVGLRFSGNYSGAMGSLTLSADSIIDLGSGSVRLLLQGITFSTHTLSFYNWTGLTLSEGGTGADQDRVYFGPDLSDDAWKKISFYSGSANDSFLGTGYDLGLRQTTWDSGLEGYQIIPVPEPETYATGLLLLLGGAWWMWRKRTAEGGERKAV